MKSVEQILGFLEGWELAISTEDTEVDKNNLVLKTLRDVWSYIILDPPYDSSNGDKEDNSNRATNENYTIRLPWTPEDNVKIEACRDILKDYIKGKDGPTFIKILNAIAWIDSLIDRATNIKYSNHYET